MFKDTLSLMRVDMKIAGEKEVVRNNKYSIAPGTFQTNPTLIKGKQNKSLTVL